MDEDGWQPWEFILAGAIVALAAYAWWFGL